MMKSKGIFGIGVVMLGMVMMVSFAGAADHGTVSVGGKTWLKNANCWGAKSWDEAKQLVSTLASGQCGLSDGSKAGDWVLPSKSELATMCSSKGSFSDIIETGYWSREEENSGAAHFYSMYICGSSLATKNCPFYVIARKK